MRSTGRPSRSQRGQSLVEMALILPIFLMITFGIVDLGRAVYSQMILTGAVREGCRAAIVPSNSNAVIIQKVLNAAVGVALPAGNISISGSRAPGTTVTISASYVFVPVTPFVRQAAGSALQLRATSSMVVE